MNIIFAPLKKEHPIIHGGITCPLCNNGFKGGDRISLLTVDTDLPSKVKAIPTHARCSFEGVRTHKGVISTIIDGEEPLPVVLEDGSKWTFEEIGISNITEK